ncbi:MAG: flavin monoamine oxidase family protein [Tepidiformaceae bacterium]
MTTAGEARYLEVIRDGLAPAGEAGLHVIVVGAGMAGLVAAHELKRAGHRVTVLEAQQRVGGRVRTLREPFSEGLHAEAGAMRIPRAHALTHAYVHQFGIETAPFTMNNPAAFVRFMGQKATRREFEADPRSLGLDSADAERSVGTAWEEALAPLLLRIVAGDWAGVVQEYDCYSLREFLEDVQGWSETQIELFGLVNHMESLFNSAFLELLREEAGSWFTEVVTIPGGMDQLPRAFLPGLAGDLHFGARVTALEQSPEGVRVHYQTDAHRRTMQGDAMIVALPFSVLRHIEVTPPFSREKQRAIRTLHYDQSTKIFLQFRKRFWEEDDGIVGGASVTDLPIRAIYYPEHGRETGRGVVLASYTWAQDAERWGALTAADRITQALENVALVHESAPRHFEVGASKVWHQDPYAGGAFAMFEPGQQTRLHGGIIAPEGHIHFAGEHASLAHAWIQGAIESGLRAALEVTGYG